MGLKKTVSLVYYHRTLMIVNFLTGTRVQGDSYHTIYITFLDTLNHFFRVMIYIEIRRRIRIAHTS